MRISISLASTPIEETLLVEFVSLTCKLFGDYGEREGSWRLTHMPEATLWQARASEQLVGFKAGYALTRNRYYSWLGAVLPAYRGQGIASQLMIAQHQWVTSKGYESIETSAREENRIMRNLNIENGFTEVGKRSRGSDIDIIYEKVLIQRK